MCLEEGCGNILDPGAAPYYSILTFPLLALLFPGDQLKSMSYDLHQLSRRYILSLNAPDPDDQTNWISYSCDLLTYALPHLANYYPLLNLDQSQIF